MKPSVPVPCLCVVTDRNLFLGDTDRLLRRVEAAVAGGANMVQLRERGMEPDALADLAKELRRITRGSALLVVNGSPELAQACNADGVQLPEAGMSVAEARAIMGNDRLIGRSVHSVSGAVEAEEEGADFLVAGTIYASRSHTGVDPAGPSLLADIAQQVSLPLLGIGGIGPGNVRDVMESGARGAAVIAAVLDAPDPEEASREMMSLMMQADILAGRATRGNDP
jgi:thiamine-phosphate diphosphorylase